MTAGPPRDDLDALADALQTHWGLRPTSLQPLASGHTNQSFAMDTKAGGAVVRVSWSDKPARQVGREARILHQLRAFVAPAVPRALPTRAARPFARLGRHRWLHVFDTIPGCPGTPRAPDGTLSGAEQQALLALAQLHGALRRLPAPPATPAAWLQQRLARVHAQPAPPLPALAAQVYPQRLSVLHALLARLPSVLNGPAQWLHGDFHLGNLLYVGQTLTGVVDFDEPGLGSPLLEAAFALFALSRDPTRDDTLVFDTERWQTGASVYAQAAGAPAQGLLKCRPALLAPLFALDQVLIHLEAAQRGLWRLEDGIGFWGPWHALGAQDQGDEP